MKLSWACFLLCGAAFQAVADPPVLQLSPAQFQFPILSGTYAGQNSLPLTIFNASHGQMDWISKVTTNDAGNWLTLVPSSGSVPEVGGPNTGFAFVAVNPGGLKPGTYFGTITIAASRLYEGITYPAVNSPSTVTVSYTVYQTSVPSVKLSVNTLALQGISQIGAGSSASVAISNAGQGTLNWTASADAASSAWLSVGPASGSNAGTLTVKANPGSLTPGTYTGTVTVTAPNSPVAPVMVTYTVRAPTPAVLQLSSQTINFTGGASSQQTLNVVNPGESSLNWNASTSTFNGGAWLSVAPSQGTNNGGIAVIANTAGLAPGVYAGRVTVAADKAANSPVQIQVNLTVPRPQASVDKGGFYNAASLTRDALAPGSIASIFGSHLGPAVGAVYTADAANPQPPVALAGTRVTVDGVAAPLFFASDSQVNFQVPFEEAGKTTATVRVETSATEPAEFQVPITPANPAIFSVDGTRAAAFNQDGTLNTLDNPAAAGSIVQFFATGQGVVDTPIETGGTAPLQAPFPAPVAPVTVQIGGASAKVIFSGLAPGLVGLLQLNVQIPADTKVSDLVAVQTPSASGKPHVVYISVKAAQ